MRPRGLSYDGKLPRIFSSFPGEGVVWPHVYAGISLTTLATLILELSLTRIFSVVFYYHFAFLAISIALFGLGAGGVLSYLITARGPEMYRRLGLLASGIGVVTVGSLLFLLTRGDPGLAALAAIYFITSLPFVLAGAVISLAISENIERVDRVYFFDLMGAATGCLVLVPFLNAFGGPNTVIVAAACYAASAGVWFNLGRHSAGRAMAVVLALLLVALVVINMRWPLIDVTFAKGQKLASETFVKWNSFSRIALAPDKDSGMMLIFIDADASTGIAKFDFDHLTEREKVDLKLQGPGFAYQVRPAAKTLIIGPGGGWDVARALASGSTDITGVEINPIIATTIMRQRYPGLSNRLYFRPEVRIVVEDGRSFVRRSSEKYQVLQLTLVDTWASTAAGAFALSENNLYTTDAFVDYLSHLTDDGILSFTRWGFDPPRESLRLVSLATVALRSLGENDAARHVMVIREGGARELAGFGAKDTVLISRKPFTAPDLMRARAAFAASPMQPVYLPGDQNGTPFSQLLNTSNTAAFVRKYPYDVSPVDDDRPFFFYTVQPKDVLNFLRAPALSADYKINRAVPLLFGLLAVSLTATAVILVLPPLVLGTRLPSAKGVRIFLLYFLCIGVGYILIQVALIQKFIILLGHPTYALTVIIFSMLVFSGLGSYFRRTLLGTSDTRLKIALVTAAILICILGFGAPVITNSFMGSSAGVRVVVTAALIAAPAFAMGMPFPAGLARLERAHPASVRWAWALNSASSVLGSAIAICLAVYLGLRGAMLAGAALYILAAIVIRLTQTPTLVRS